MLKKILRYVGCGLCLFCIISLFACAGSDGSQKTDPGPSPTPTIQDIDPATVLPLRMPQLEPLVPGEELVVLHTSMGDIKLRMFPEGAPKAVENFLTHARAGYYDGVIFHRVIEDFMIQGGDPTGTGMGGESIWGGGFAYEFALNLRHFRGALAMAHSSLPDSNGSQFYIVQNHNLYSEYKTDFEEMLEYQDTIISVTEDGIPIFGKQMFPESAIREYVDNGGTPHLDLLFNEDGHTVFGHVVEGMDVVDAIAAVAKDNNGKPLKDVVIERVSFEIAP